MADAPVDLSPFRSMVGFSSAGSYIALVSITASTDNGEGSLQNWIEFVDPAIGEFGLSKDWGLPADETDETLLYGYDAYSGSNIGTPFGSLGFVNIARTLGDHPDPERTHLVLDHVFEPFTSSDPGRTGYVRCEVYRGPLLADMIEHLDRSAIHDALLSMPMKTAFQYRRDGVVGRIGEFEQAIIVDTVQRRMRISLPLGGEDHTPGFELI